MATALIWFRNDLRLDDNPALQAALGAGLMPVPIYIHAPTEEGDWPPGAASDAWRHRSLTALDAELRKRGSRLRCFTGPSATTLQALASAAGAEAVFWNRRYEPVIVERDGRIKRDLRRLGLRVESFNGSLLFEPWELQTKAGEPYRVFTPFWRAAQTALRLPSERRAPDRLPDDATIPLGDAVAALALEPRLRWDRGFWQEWTPGESGATAALGAFAREAQDYPEARDQPARRGTSRLSPHLHFGEIARGESCMLSSHPPRLEDPASSPSFASSDGASSPTMCFITFHTRPRATSIRASMRSRGSRRRRRSSRRGYAAALAYQSSTPACANSGRRAGCTTASG